MFFHLLCKLWAGMCIYVTWCFNRLRVFHFLNRFINQHMELFIVSLLLVLNHKLDITDPVVDSQVCYLMLQSQNEIFPHPNRACNWYRLKWLKWLQKHWQKEITVWTAGPSRCSMWRLLKPPESFHHLHLKHYCIQISELCSVNTNGADAVPEFMRHTSKVHVGC